MRAYRQLCALIALTIVACALIAQQSQGQDALSNEIDTGPSPGDGRYSGGMLGMILSPLRTTIDHATRLLGHRFKPARDLVTGGYNQVQLRTFRMFMSLYNKTYSPEEIPRRMALFFARRKEIEKSAREFFEGRVPFMMRENSFIDWDESELKALTGVSPPRSFDELSLEERQAVIEQRQHEQEQANEWPDGVPSVTRARRSIDDSENFIDQDDMNMTVKQTERIPASKDWRTSGCISTPINQFKCGACYAIASMSVLESMRCLRQVSSPVLAPQQVVDCATPRAGYQNYGCDGGWPTRVMRYLQDVGVAARESCYPFVRRQLSCRLPRVSGVPGCTVRASPSDTSLRYKVLNNERDILYHVAKTGPVVTVMRATNNFLYYDTGIFDDPKCSRKRDDVDHAIVIVGYGTENGVDYWLIKNSWGTADWGQGGYGKYRRGTNACSIGHWGWVITA